MHPILREMHEATHWSRKKGQRSQFGSAEDYTPVPTTATRGSLPPSVAAVDIARRCKSINTNLLGLMLASMVQVASFYVFERTASFAF
jgi:hypothetical protein